MKNILSYIFLTISLLSVYLISGSNAELPNNLTKEQVSNINEAASSFRLPDGSKPWDKPDYPYYWKVNGCGPNKWFSVLIPDGPKPGSTLWIEKCNAHDRAYMTLTNPDTPTERLKARFNADKKLFDGMLQACGTDNDCKTIARGYILPISIWPQSNFDKSIETQKEYQAWALQYLKDHGLLPITNGQ